LAEEHESVSLPRQPIDRLVKPLQRFIHISSASGVVLLICTVIAVVFANSPLAEGWAAFWKTKNGFAIGGFEFKHSIKHWINDGLMAIFFFVVGLEVKREIVLGELRDMRRASLPIIAALGGMVVPAGIYLALQGGTEAARGWGIPMATDIAFVVGCMALLGPRVPHGLRIAILSLAIADDIGAILVIAIGYTEGLSIGALVAGFAGIVLIYVMARLGVRSFAAFTLFGLLVWFAFHESGVHATIAGVILGLMTPARRDLSTSIIGKALKRLDELLHGNWEERPHRAAEVRQVQKVAKEAVSPLEYLENALHPWVSFAIMPIFALANAGVAIEVSSFADPVALAVAAGLVVGKPVGIVLFSWLGVKAGLAQLPQGVSWGALAGGGCLAGIGFTMALFIAGLALEGPMLDAAKVGILTASAVAAALGMALLVKILPKPAQ
jgi:NhaA family Na+:H+ antiporter